MDILFGRWGDRLLRMVKSQPSQEWPSSTTVPTLFPVGPVQSRSSRLALRALKPYRKNMFEVFAIQWTCAPSETGSTSLSVRMSASGRCRPQPLHRKCALRGSWRMRCRLHQMDTWCWLFVVYTVLWSSARHRMVRLFAILPFQVEWMPCGTDCGRSKGTSSSATDEVTATKYQRLRVSLGHSVTATPETVFDFPFLWWILLATWRATMRDRSMWRTRRIGGSWCSTLTSRFRGCFWWLKADVRIVSPSTKKPVSCSSDWTAEWSRCTWSTNSSTTGGSMRNCWLEGLSGIPSKTLFSIVKTINNVTRKTFLSFLDFDEGFSLILCICLCLFRFKLCQERFI